MCVYVNVHICVFISIPQNPQTLMPLSVPLHMLFAQLSARVAFLLSCWSSKILCLKIQMKCLRKASSVTPEFCASEDHLSLGRCLPQ